jgi:hypothetical protein
MTLKVKQVASGQRNVTYQVGAFLPDGNLPLTPVDIHLGERVKLTALLWIVQEKLAVDLWWAEGDLLLTMESRNSVRFDSAVAPPKGWDGRMFLSSIPDTGARRSFFLVMDFDI